MDSIPSNVDGCVVVRATDQYDQFASKRSVFLAGSIEMDKAEPWQEKFIDGLSDLDILVLNPRRGTWDSSMAQTIDNPALVEQVTWEMDALEKSTYIIMYFDPNTKSPISLLELGLHAASGKMIVCLPDGFWRAGNVEIVCQRYNIPLTKSLDELIAVFRNAYREYNTNG